MTKFPLVRNGGAKDCGPCCLKMVAAYYGKFYSLDKLRERCGVTKTGVSMLDIHQAAEEIGFRPAGMKMSSGELAQVAIGAPLILHWQMNHFVVLYKVRKNKFYVADPALGYVTYTSAELEKRWYLKNEEYGHALLPEPTPAFYENSQQEEEPGSDWSRLFHYFKTYRFYFLQVAGGMLLGSLFALAAPLLTQALVDNGINNRDIDLVYLILLAQLVLFAGSTMIEAIRTWLILHIGTRINISMVSDFFLKLMNLPISFFDSHHAGDLMQRIDSHKRIENLITVNTLSTIFSVVNMVFLSAVLCYYNLPIFFTYMTGSVIGLCWILLFLKKRRLIDAQFFEAYGSQSTRIIETLSGVQDIKISNGAQQRRKEWEILQSRIFDVKIKSLSYSQFQNIGTSFINRLTSLIITIISAKAVINGEITLGGMFAISMLVGQLSSPVQQLLGFVTTLQDAKIGWERILRVWQQADEDPADANSIREIPDTADIRMEHMSFSYSSRGNDKILKDINLLIPAGKVTAIVGPSGSGKTTLMKLLLKFYSPTEGNILLNDYHFSNLHHQKWREKCGAVLQDGQMFSGTIAENIALGCELNMEEVIRAAKIACIDTFIHSLPQGYLTEIGTRGTQLSTGQRQRVFLARALYKNPAYLFLDEATNSLDTANEKQVMENLSTFFKGRTVVVIAHRLSTVKNADQLIVMDNGEVLEIGKHSELTHKHGFYYHLVKNQLELGNT